MRFAGFTLALIALPLVACAAAAPGSSSDDTEDTAIDAESLSKRTPIPYVLQYVGAYDGAGGSVRSITLGRDGTWVGVVDGVEKHGRFYGPRRPTSPLVITFVTRGEHFVGEIGPWSAHATMTLTRLGVAEKMTSPWLSSNESMCDDSHGHWRDDEADPVTGLFCVCDAPNAFIPSLGGCVP